VRVVVVTDYNSLWPGMFEVEADKIREVFGQELIAVYHFGSTSVLGLKAKPIIDIMPLVRDIEVVDNVNDKMIALGYEPMGEFGIPGRRLFQIGGDNRTHHVHVFEHGSIGAERFPNDIEAYIDGKTDLVKSLEQKAIKWNRERI